MIPDFQTSMKEIREANDDFVALLMKLKALLAENVSIEFILDGVPVTVPSLPKVIEQYRGGQFSELVLKSGAKELRLVNDSGVLRVTDETGALATMEVGSLLYSAIEQCTIEQADIQECVVDSLEALGGLSLDRATAQALEVQEFKGTVASVGQLDVSQLTAESLTVGDLAVGRLSLYPKAVQSLFTSPATGPYNYDAANAIFTAVGTNSRYACSSTRTGWKDPSTMGFVDLPTDVADTADPKEWVREAPDMVVFQGNTTYDKYEKKYCLNCYAIGATGNIQVGQARVVQGGGSVPAPFSQILAWPWKSVAKDPSQYAALSGLPDSGDGLIFVHEAPDSDVGRIVYIHTLGNPWKIARCLTDTYQAGVLVKSELSMIYEVPPFTCLRLRVEKLTSTTPVSPTSVATRVLTILELT